MEPLMLLAETLGSRVSCPCGRQHLTVREIDILLRIAAGRSADQAGQSLCISRRTVEYHLAAMQRRTGAQSSVELVARCYAAGILVPEAWPPRWSGQLCITGIPARQAS
jgi:DNA-binding CsgD family transcriptional regulator